MRKITTLLAVLLATVFVHAQGNLTVSMPSPTQGQTVGPGIGFDFVITVTNTGSTDVTNMDTITFAPLVEGQTLLDQNNNLIAFQYLGPIAANGGSRTDTVTFNSLGIQGAPAGTIEWCALAFANGPNWNGIVGETDTADNISCVDLSYDPNGAVSIDEHGLLVRLKPVNTSYYHDGTLHLRVSNVPDGERVQMRIYDLQGKLVHQETVESSNYQVKQNMPLRLSRGVYMLQLEHNHQAIGHNKILVQ